MCNLLAWLYLLPYCCVTAALLLSILLCMHLNRQIALMSDFQAKLMATSPAKCRPIPIPTKRSGKSRTITTHRNQLTRRPAYPRHRNWKLKGARFNSRWNAWRMFRPKHLTLYHIRRQKQVQRMNTTSRTAENKRRPEQASNGV